MLAELPLIIDPKSLALQGYLLKGEMALARLNRLSDSLCKNQGTAKIEWLFGFDDQQRPTIQGYVQAQLSMRCQRCLQPMQWPLDIQVALIILNYEPRPDEELPIGYEAITLINNQMSVPTLIEEEIILALPIVAKHKVCPTNEYQLSQQPIDNNTSPNPFHILSKLQKH